MGSRGPLMFGEGVARLYFRNNMDNAKAFFLDGGIDWFNSRIADPLKNLYEHPLDTLTGTAESLGMALPWTYFAAPKEKFAYDMAFLEGLYDYTVGAVKAQGDVLFGGSQQDYQKAGVYFWDGASMVATDGAVGLSSRVFRFGGGKGVVPNTFNPAKRSGLDFDTSVQELPNGLQKIKITSNQVILHNGSLTVPTRPNPNGAFNLIDSRFNPSTGELNVDYVFTFNKGKGVGSELISRAVETAGPQNVKSIVGQLGADNRKIFDSGISQGLSPLDAALKTPAEKIRQNLGFKNLNVTFDVNGNPILRGSR